MRHHQAISRASVRKGSSRVLYGPSIRPTSDNKRSIMQPDMRHRPVTAEKSMYQDCDGSVSGLCHGTYVTYMVAVWPHSCPDQSRIMRGERLFHRSFQWADRRRGRRAGVQTERCEDGVAIPAHESIRTPLLLVQRHIGEPEGQTSRCTSIRRTTSPAGAIRCRCTGRNGRGPTAGVRDAAGAHEQSSRIQPMGCRSRRQLALPTPRQDPTHRSGAMQTRHQGGSRRSLR